MMLCSNTPLFLSLSLWPTQQDVEMREQERGPKRPKPSSQSDRTLAEEEEVAVKRPKLMEPPPPSSSHNPQTDKLKVLLL